MIANSLNQSVKYTKHTHTHTHTHTHRYTHAHAHTHTHTHTHTRMYTHKMYSKTALTSAMNKHITNMNNYEMLYEHLLYYNLNESETILTSDSFTNPECS